MDRDWGQSLGALHRLGGSALFCVMGGVAGSMED